MADQDIVPMSEIAKTIEMVNLNPLVSIIIPTCSSPELLKSCLASIFAYTDLSMCEVIVVANGAPDETIQYLKTIMPVLLKSVVSPDRLGFPGAVNLGISKAIGEYVVLLNDDVTLLRQQKNSWIETLLTPFRNDFQVGVTGPVQFFWDCGGITRHAIAFWCAMIPRRLFSELGDLDTIFNPGMGEDGDFCIKAELKGYRLVQVPVDGASKFGTGIQYQNFPAYHIGSATFGKKDYSDIQKRNSQILVDRYGKKEVKQQPKDDLETIYDMCVVHECDTNRLFPTLRAYSEKCSHITEFGVRGVMTTWAFLAARPKRMVSYDLEYNGNIDGAKKEASKAGISFEFRQENTLHAEIEETDLLFVDTKHTYSQLISELNRHAGKVSKYIAIHDTESFGLVGEDGGVGEKVAIQEFLLAHPEWTQKEHIEISNGLTILERRKVEKEINISIVIPTCGKDWESVLKGCIERVLEFTDMSDKEIVVVPNGAPKEALEYLKTKPVEIMEMPNRVGYIRAVNIGIKAAWGKHIILLDDDSLLMPQQKDVWVKILLQPFLDDPKMGAAGPFGQTYDDLGEVLHSGCTMYDAKVLREVKLFDEAFNPGYMGDEDLAIRIRKAGYNLQLVPKGSKPKYVNGIFEIQFPVLHTGTVATMPKHTIDLPLVKKNRDLLYERHAKGTDPKEYAKGEPGLSGVAGVKTPKISIVIPTAFAKLDELLKPAIESIVAYTDMDQTEVIVVANGCTDGTADYVKSLGPKFKLVVFEDAIGYTRATNEGIKVSTGDFIILFNNDVVLLGQPRNQWIDILLTPYKNNPKMGITGPLQLHDDYADADVIIGFCLCISRVALEAVGGLLDEIYSPGGGEDIDLCCKVRQKGFGVRQVPDEGKLGFSHTNTGNFPIWHKNNCTFKDIPEYTRFIVKKNGLVNTKRYNKNIRLNVGSGGIEYPGYLSVDLYDRRATIIMDATKLDFEENSVSEILSIHMLEHISPYILLDTLKLWFKVLKPGGKLTAELPDLEALCKRYVTASTGERYGIGNAIYGSVNTTGEGDPSQITSPHLFGYDKQMIWDHLSNAGFRNIQFMPERFPHPEPPNMSFDAYKP